VSAGKYGRFGGVETSYSGSSITADEGTAVLPNVSHYLPTNRVQHCTALGSSHPNKTSAIFYYFSYVHCCITITHRKIAQGPFQSRVLIQYVALCQLLRN